MTNKKIIYNHKAFFPRSRKCVACRFLFVVFARENLGYTYDKIASLFGVSKTTIWRYLKRASISSKRKVLNAETITKIKEMRKNNMSYAEIAEKLGVSRSSAYKYGRNVVL